jgi:hypothetical protein
MTFSVEVDTRCSKMPEEMQKFAIESAQNAITNHSNDRTEMARFVRNEFDNKYGKYWGCIIGDDFSGSVTNEKPYLIVFKMHSLIKCARFIIFKNAEK